VGESEKKALREEIARRISGLSPEQRAAASRAACRALMHLAAYARAKTVLAFAPMPDEIDTSELLKSALRSGRRLALPLVLWRTRELRAVEVKDLASDVVEGPHGVPGPRPDGPVIPAEELDLIVVPGRAFDWDGNRLGRGGGYYDRLLASPGRAEAVAIAFSCQLARRVPVSPHDVPVGTIVTEQGALFTSARKARPGRV
jgi:5-formyltetrahydrofolate cyclo-ligase